MDDIPQMAPDFFFLKKKTMYLTPGKHGAIGIVILGYILGLCWGYIGVYIGMMENETKTTILYWKLTHAGFCVFQQSGY